MADMKCENCYFFAADDSHCRINPPVMVPTPQGLAATWPGTRGRMWCGKFKDREEEIAEGSKRPGGEEAKNAQAPLAPLAFGRVTES